MRFVIEIPDELFVPGAGPRPPHANSTTADSDGTVATTVNGAMSGGAAPDAARTAALARAAAPEAVSAGEPERPREDNGPAPANLSVHDGGPAPTSP
jgi:hypothetical protein